MPKVSELVSQNIGSAIANFQMWGNIIINPKVSPYNAKGDGVTDDSAAINAALVAAYTAGGGTVLLPTGQYYVGSKLTILAKCTLMGIAMGSDVNNANVKIIGSLALSPIVELNGGGGSAQTSLRNVSVSRVSGSIPVSAIGVKVTNTDYSSIVDTSIDRHGVGLDLEGNNSSNCDRVIIYSIEETYVIINNIVQATFIDCSFGRNGGENGIVATDVIQIKGVADTISFLRCQINPTTAGTLNGINFKGFTSANGIVVFTACHIENMRNVIVSDAATPLISKLIINGCSISTLSTFPFVSLNAATAISEWTIVNNFITGTTTILNGSKLIMTGNSIVGELVLNLLKATISNNVFYTGITVGGAWTSLIFTGNIFDGVAQVLTDNATGKKSIYGNITAGAYINPTILPEDYIKLGTGIPFGIQRYTGTLDGAGNASVTHGIFNAHKDGLICQAFYKGASDEMIPATVNYINSAVVSITGVASAKYRVAFMFSNVVDNW